MVGLVSWCFFLTVINLNVRIIAEDLEGEVLDIGLQQTFS